MARTNTGPIDLGESDSTFDDGLGRRASMQLSLPLSLPIPLRARSWHFVRGIYMRTSRGDVLASGGDGLFPLTIEETRLRVYARGPMPR